MADMKQFAEKISVVLGYEGQINDSVLELGNQLLELSESYGLEVKVDGSKIILEQTGERK